MSLEELSKRISDPENFCDFEYFMYTLKIGEDLFGLSYEDIADYCHRRRKTVLAWLGNKSRPNAKDRRLLLEAYADKIEQQTGVRPEPTSYLLDVMCNPERFARYVDSLHDGMVRLGRPTKKPWKIT